MKKLFVFLMVAASLFVALARPVQAGVVVEDVLVLRKGVDVNIRVTVHNDTARRVQKPAIVLFVRKDRWRGVDPDQDLERHLHDPAALQGVARLLRGEQQTAP